MKCHRKTLSALWILFAGAVLAICLAYVVGSGAESQEPTSFAPQIVEVTIICVQEKQIEPWMELPGRVAAFRIAEVRPQINGIVQNRLFTEGADVKAGDTLYQIDPDIYEATLESARASLARAQAIEYAARLKAERYENLVDTRAVSIQEQTEIQAAWKQAEAQVLAAMAAVKTAQLNLNYTQIKAPINGRIGKSLVSEGALVTAQQSSALATIQQLDPVYVDVSQSADDLLRLRTQILKNDSQAAYSKTRVRVLLPDEIHYEQMGELAFSDVSVDPATGAVILRAIVPNPDQVLLPGMFVRARLISSQKQQVLTVPQASLIRNSKGQSSVMVVTPESVVENRMVQTGQIQGQDIVITQGLNRGEQVVVSGLQRIRPGMPVHPTLITAESSVKNSEN